MFCYQCEQTAFNKGCNKIGVCGKKPNTSDLMDKLLNKVFMLANSGKKDDETINLIVTSLFMTLTNVNFDNDAIENQLLNIEKKFKNCKCNFDIQSIFKPKDNTSSFKSIILFALKGMSAYYHHSLVLGYKDSVVEDFLIYALIQLTKEKTIDELINLVLKTGEVNLKCMELLDRANTETFLNPTPTCVSTNIEKGPFIVVSGHDLNDLKLLLEATKDLGINIYTHGELLPAHGYPKLKEYKHLKGNFGTAWQNQQKEFKNILAPILFTTNCIMPVDKSYMDRVFTTCVVGYPNCNHIKNCDFSLIIKKALELKGYKEYKKMKGINGGELLTVGFGHDFILKNLSKIINLLNQGKIRHIFVVGGCDGAKSGRNYYTDFVKKVPDNCIILTFACGKYRFNDLDLGGIEGIPRLLDMGQCNDCYGVIVVLNNLAKALKAEINELPVSFVLSWYEQKAICILVTLFYLGIKNITLGPSLPAFLSQDVLDFLIETFKISLIKNPNDDIKKMLKD